MPRRVGTQRAGDRSDKIQIQRATTGRDEYGAETQQWETIATPWASVDPLRMTEMFVAGSERAGEIHVFRIPYTSDVRAKDRVIYKGEPYDIEGIREVGRRQSTEITARYLR